MRTWLYFEDPRSFTTYTCERFGSLSDPDRWCFEPVTAIVAARARMTSSVPGDAAPPPPPAATPAVPARRADPIAPVDGQR